MVKSNRNGQAATLSSEQLDAIIEELTPSIRAVFSICRFTAARISEALNLRWENITQIEVVIPKNITKKKMKTRAIPMNPRLWEEITSWKQRWREVQNRDPDRGNYVFPNAKDPARHMTRQAVDKALRGVCSELEVIGASTHSLRRSALTAASDKGVPLRVLQSISGHSSLEMLQRYLDVKDEAKRAAAMAFG
jgi:integrase/recombinase XerD